METSRILNWRRWSPTRKTQVIVTALGLLLTTGFMLLHALASEVPSNWQSAGLLELGMALGAPSNAVADSLGLWKTIPPWGLRLLALSVNGALGFALGTILGWLITMVQQTRKWVRTRVLQKG